MTNIVVSVLCAVSNDGGFGYRYPSEHEYKMPWHCPEDMRRFQKMTLKNVVVMGSETYLSLPPNVRPLPDRINIILSTSPDKFKTELESESNVIVLTSLSLLLEWIQNNWHKKVFVIGGKSLITQILSPENIFSNCISEIHRTVIHQRVFGETGVVTDQETHKECLTFNEMLHPDQEWPQFVAGEMQGDTNHTFQTFVRRK